MSKMRIYELAKQLGVANKELMEKMKSVGMEANSHMSMIEESDADKIRKLYQPAQKAEEPKKEAPKQEVKEQHKGNPVSYTHLVQDGCTGQVRESCRQ